MQASVVIAASSWWPLAAKIAVSLLDHGCKVEAVCAPGHPLRHVRGISRYHHYSRLRSLDSLKKAIRAASPDVVIPCDDGVVLQLHQLYEEQPDLRMVIARSLGEAKHFEVVASRERLQNIAEELGIRVPRSARIMTQDDLSKWFDGQVDRAVLKQDGTWGGRGVRVVDSQAEAAAELKQMLRPLSWLGVCKRMAVDRDPIAFWSRKDNTPVVTLQEYIPGRPANLMMACWKGDILGAVTAEVLQAQGATSAAMVVKLIQHPEIAQAAFRLAKRLELSGFYGVDFILEEETRAAYLLELNPRCTQLGHLPIDAQGDLVGLLCRQLGVEPREHTTRLSRYSLATAGAGHGIAQAKLAISSMAVATLSLGAPSPLGETRGVCGHAAERPREFVHHDERKQTLARRLRRVTQGTLA
jgi:hypothetical protein